MEEVALIYRKPSEERKSIERLFRVMEKQPEVKRYELPYDLNSLKAALQIFWWGLKIKEKNIHITGDVHYIAFFLFWKKSILTIHDCHYYENNLSGLKKMFYGLIWFRLPIFCSDKIVAVSPFTKERILKNFNVRDKKIDVILNRILIKEMNKSNNINNSQKNRPFKVLVIGTKENKNIDRLLYAVNDLKDISVIIVGNIYPALNRLLKELNITYQRYMNISNKELEYLYKTSDMLYFVSLREGFGLPILEAQICGLPVLSSNIEPMKFVAGEGALLVNPFDVADIKKGIENLRNNQKLKKELISRGYKNINRFKTKVFQSQYQNLYNSIFNL